MTEEKDGVSQYKKPVKESLINKTLLSLGGKKENPSNPETEQKSGQSDSNKNQ